MDIVIHLTPEAGADPNAIGEALFDLLCELAPEDLVFSIDGWDPVR